MSDFAKPLEAAVSELNVTGASFAYWDGVTLHTAVAGLRNSITGEPVTLDTVMHIGSITKVLNTVLLMQLVDEGRIALEDAITKHLPELRLRDREALRRITCAMLVNHTSGVNGDWLPEYGPDQERIVDAIDRCAELGQLFSPGEAASYCNIATVIAGYLIQKLRGTSWYILVKKRIYEPLGMEHALADAVEAPRFRCSIGDLTDPATGSMVQTTRPFLTPSFAPAGSTLMMTATDLLLFARAMLNGGLGVDGVRILSTAAATLMTSPTAAFVSPAYQVGLGWMIAPGDVLVHSGTGPGVQSVLCAHSASGRAVALLTNCDRGGLLRSAMVDPVVESWTGVRKQIPKRESRIVDPQPYEGVYESNLQRIEVFARDGGLAMHVSVKMKMYDNSPYQESAAARRALALQYFGQHTFEAEPMLPRGPRVELKFIEPDACGRMRFLGMGYRLLVRTL